MKATRPSIDQERWLTLAARYPGLHAAAQVTQGAGGWKTASWPSRCLFFVLGCIGAGMLAGLFMGLPAPALLSGVALLGYAEWLIGQRRLLRSGIEEALWLCGALALAMQLLLWFEPVEVVDALMIAVALGLAGWRLLNPGFTTLAALALSFAVAWLGEANWSNWHHGSAALFCFATALSALLLGGRSYQRPAHDRMLDALVIVMPVAAYGWMLVGSDSFWSGPNRSPNELALIVVPPLLLFALGCLVTGIRRRTHAPLLSAVGCVLSLAHALRAITGLALHWRLILWGSLALLVAVWLERWLRTPRHGVTSRAVRDNRTLDLLQMAGAASITPQPGAPPNAYPGQGGDFGGGGASGRY